jgi:voltage-gated potassium channel
MWKPAVFLFIIIFIGTAGYVLIEDMTPLDSLYMTTITIFTVGFREVKPLSPLGKFFTIMIICGGVGTAIFAFTQVGEIIYEGGINKFWRRRRMENRLKKIKDHYIICGCGRMGHIVCERLEEEKIPYVVIDSREETIKELKETCDCIAIIGDASSEEVLIEAGVKRAKALAALLPSDADNLYLVLTVRLLHPSIFILSKVLEDEAEKKILQIGANKVVSPYKLSGLKLAQGLIRPTLVDFLDLIIRRQEISLSMEEFIVTKNSKIINQTLIESDVRKQANVIVVAAKKPGKDIVFNPSPDIQIGNGDTLLVLGDEQGISEFEKLYIRETA